MFWAAPTQNTCTCSNCMFYARGVETLISAPTSVQNLNNYCGTSAKYYLFTRRVKYKNKCFIKRVLVRGDNETNNKKKQSMTTNNIVPPFFGHLKGGDTNEKNFKEYYRNGHLEAIIPLLIIVVVTIFSVLSCSTSVLI